MLACTTRDLWHEGLANQALLAVRIAYDLDYPLAAVALADLEQKAGASVVARSIVKRLARELPQRTRMERRLEALARERLADSSPDLN